MTRSAVSIPTSPGVYFFKDKKDKIIYIGKAKSLKKRVGSYFNKSAHDIKTSVMIKHIYDIDFLVVKNEAEALISESNLIKINKHPCCCTPNILVLVGQHIKITHCSIKHSSLPMMIFRVKNKR
mgnify:CR=1 FL=1